MPMVVPNTITKVADKAMLQKIEDVYIQELMPQQVGVVGVKFAAELLVMGLRMTLHVYNDFVIINIDLRNAYTDILRVAICEEPTNHDKSRLMEP
jgi:hypothetical protein